jgi:hypothetical protein
MTLIKKRDVDSYLSARRKKIVFPFAPASQPSATGNSRGTTPGEKITSPGSHQLRDREPASIPPVGPYVGPVGSVD